MASIFPLRQSDFSGPVCILSVPGEYRLEESVVAPRSGIVVSAPNVTINLNGLALTYGDDPGIDAADIAWTRTLGDLLIQPRIPGMGDSHSYALLPEKTGVGSATSDRVTIPQSPQPRLWCAAIQCKGTVGTVATLTVYDGATGSVLRKGSIGTVNGPGGTYGIEKGFSIVLSWSSALMEGETVYLEISTQGGTLDFGHVSIRPIGEYGISLAYRPAENLVIHNGIIVQGRGRASSGSPLMLDELQGSVLEDLDIHYYGDDTHGISLRWGKNARIHRCGIYADCERVSVRTAPIAGINLSDYLGSAEVYRCEIIGVPQVGLFYTGREPGTVLVQSLRVIQDGLVTNSYGIIASNATNLIVQGCYVNPRSGRGILLDSYQGQKSEQVTIKDCYFAAIETRPNIEYPSRTALEATAMRIRIFPDSPYGNLIIKNNTCESWSTEDSVTHEAIGGRLSVVGGISGGIANFVSITNNTFIGIASGTSSAVGFSISRIENGNDIELRGNEFISNHVGFRIGDRDGWGQEVAEVYGMDNTIRSIDYDARVFLPVYLGGQGGLVREVQFSGTILHSPSESVRASSDARVSLGPGATIENTTMGWV